MARKLLIVESPAKAKTIGKYLGEDFSVKSSVGHVRDLPKASGAIRISPAGEGRWTFEPKYEISEGKEKVVKELKAAVKAASEVYLASDPDREGEAIAWHLREVLAPGAEGKRFCRVTYNEITKGAVLKAIGEPRDIDMPRVDAQQSRRILDRIVGYKVSPLLWKSIPCSNNRTLSAGRVQSVALRLLVERQREIDAFKPETYYLLGVEARRRAGGRESFVAKLARYDGEKPSVGSRHDADAMLLDLADAELEVADLRRQPRARRPLPPFTTSTMQQAASSVLGFSPGKTMKTAQALYERGLITYMRTDSVNVSESARKEAQALIVDRFGPQFYPEKPNFYKSKASAQEAHEAIRPTQVSLDVGEAGLDAAEAKLYDLVWRRFIASQMSEARTELKTATLEARKPGIVHSYVFSASATEVLFEGFLKVMQLKARGRKADEDDDEDGDEVESLPDMAVGETLDAERWMADEKSTKGPSHYSEASLVKALEENGVGRPSTYATTIETLKTRGYAKTEKRKLVPLERGTMVCDWLVKKLDSLFNVGYTAEMEAELDKVEEGAERMDDMLSDFYAKFLQSVAACAEPPPDKAKFEGVFALLDEVRAWKEPRKSGKRVYDDKAFVESVREQYERGDRPLSAKQLDYLVRIVRVYEDQIADASRRLRELGVSGTAAGQVEAVDQELVRLCFDAASRAEALSKNEFVKSLRDQADRGRGLSQRQFAVLARTVVEHSADLADGETLREKLAPFVPEGFSSLSGDPSLPGLLAMADEVQTWRPSVKRGRRTYDDKRFVESLKSQYARRSILSARQTAALKRLISAYKGQIADYDARAEKLGIVPSGAKNAS